MFLIKHHTSEHYCVEPNMEIWLDNIHNVGRSFTCKHNTKQSCDQRMRWCIMPGTATGPRRSQLDAYIPQEHTRGFICCKHAITANSSLYNVQRIDLQSIPSDLNSANYYTQRTRHGWCRLMAMMIFDCWTCETIACWYGRVNSAPACVRDSTIFWRVVCCRCNNTWSSVVAFLSIGIVISTQSWIWF
jgi:hypothetical protein